jgi:hypothetical protein
MRAVSYEYVAEKVTSFQGVIDVVEYRAAAGPEMTLLEVHKLMYFMQESGEPLRLQYSKAPYEPYAENLRHVLRAVEGQLVSVYADGGMRQTSRSNSPGAVKDAEAFLEEKQETVGGSISGGSW